MECRGASSSPLPGENDAFENDYGHHFLRNSPDFPHSGSGRISVQQKVLAWLRIRRIQTGAQTKRKRSGSLPDLAGDSVLREPRKLRIIPSRLTLWERLTSIAGSQVSSLVRELGSHKPLTSVSAKSLQ